MNAGETEYEMLNCLLSKGTSEDYEDTGSLIKLYLNIVENNDCNADIDYIESIDEIDEIAFYTIDNYIEIKTTDEMTINGHLEDLQEFNHLTTERSYWLFLQNNRGNLENMMANLMSADLESAVELWSCQDQLRTELNYWNDDLIEEISDKINILITYWREKRNRKRKQLINKLKIHSVEHLVMAYL